MIVCSISSLYAGETARTGPATIQRGNEIKNTTKTFILKLCSLVASDTYMSSSRFLLSFDTITVIETRGALKNFMAQTAAQTEGPGLWAKLKRDANPAAEGKTWNTDQSTLGTGKGVGSPGLFKKPSSGGSGPQNRSFNPRAAGRKTSGSGDSDGAGSPGNVYLGGASGKKRRGEADDGIDEQAVIEESRRNDDDGEDEEIPPEILSVLEEDKFIKEVRSKS